MSANSNSITIGPRFFQTELRNYANPKTAFAREMIQNSRDAGCTVMRLIIDDGENSSNIRFFDNGKGMSRDILLNKYLVMGETGKEDNDSVGGFGKARVLTCFAAKSYTIVSDNYILSGSGANYEITGNELTTGCQFHIEQPKADWAEYFRYVLDRSTLYSSHFYINGERYISKMANKGRLVRMLSFGAVFANKSVKTKKLIVRVAGIFMFERDIEANAQVVVELDPAMSREVLLSNRDSLVWEKQRELDAFLNELAADTNSALRDRTRTYSRVVNAGMCLTAKANKADKSTPEDKASSQAAGTITNTTLNDTYHAPNIQEAPVDSKLKSLMDDPILQTMMIMNHSNDPKRVALINNFYHPEKWDKPTGTRYQLLKIWAAINAIVMRELATMQGVDIPYSNGWVFTDSEDRAEAMHTRISGVNYLLLNPIGEDNKIKYSVNNPDNYFDLIVLSCHECSHTISGRHDELFSTTFTYLMQAVLKCRKEIVNACKEAK